MSVVYTVYQTTCLVNGKTYIGCHKTRNPNDSYLGSGVLFSRAVEKYGKENFKKEVLFIFDNPEEMLAKERELVIVDPDKTYNLDRGGWPGWGSRDPEKLLLECKSSAIKGQAALQKKHPGLVEEILKKGTLQVSLLYQTDKEFQELMREHWRNSGQKALSPESMAKRKETFRAHGHAQGEKNSQFGTCWVNLNGVPKRIKKADLDTYLDQGYGLGRGSIFRSKMKDVS